MSYASEGDVNTSEARAAHTAGLDAGTRKLLDRDAAVFLHQALSTPCLDVIVHAEGSWLTTASGRRLLDFHGNSVHQLGHAHPDVVAAVKAQIDTLSFCPRRYTCEPAVRLAEKLAELAPDPLGKVLLAPSGSAAVGMALKLARYATGRHKTISMWDAFHGANLDAISVGGEALFRRDVGPLLPCAEHVPPPGLARRFFGDDDRAADRLADYIDYVLEVQGDVAAVIAEPIRWTTVEPPPPGFWPKVRRAATATARSSSSTRSPRRLAVAAASSLSSRSAASRTWWSSARASAEGSCPSPRSSRGATSTSPGTRRSATTRTRRARSAAPPRSPSSPSSSGKA